MALAAIAAGTAIAGGVASLAGGIGGARATRQAGKYTARQIRAETHMQVQRAQEELDWMLGATRAAQGASGVATDSLSSQVYLDAALPAGPE